MIRNRALWIAGFLLVQVALAPLVGAATSVPEGETYYSIDFGGLLQKGVAKTCGVVDHAGSCERYAGFAVTGLAMAGCGAIMAGTAGFGAAVVGVPCLSALGMSIGVSAGVAKLTGTCDGVVDCAGSFTNGVENLVTKSRTGDAGLTDVGGALLDGAALVLPLKGVGGVVGAGVGGKVLPGVAKGGAAGLSKASGLTAAKNAAPKFVMASTVKAGSGVVARQASPLGSAASKSLSNLAAKEASLAGRAVSRLRVQAAADAASIAPKYSTRVLNLVKGGAPVKASTSLGTGMFAKTPVLGVTLRGAGKASEAVGGALSKIPKVGGVLAKVPTFARSYVRYHPTYNGMLFGVGYGAKSSAADVGETVRDIDDVLPGGTVPGGGEDESDSGGSNDGSSGGSDASGGSSGSGSNMPNAGIRVVIQQPSEGDVFGEGELVPVYALITGTGKGISKYSVSLNAVPIMGERLNGAKSHEVSRTLNGAGASLPPGYYELVVAADDGSVSAVTAKVRFAVAGEAGVPDGWADMCESDADADGTVDCYEKWVHAMAPSLGGKSSNVGALIGLIIILLVLAALAIGLRGGL